MTSSPDYVRGLIKTTSAESWRRSWAKTATKYRTTSAQPTEPPPLLDWIPTVSPHLTRPTHLAPIADRLERAKAEPVLGVVSVPPQHGKPVDERELVSMADGSVKPLAEVRVGDFVMSGLGRPTRVEAVFEQGELPVLQIETRQGRTLRAEASHLVMTRRGWVRVDELKPYHRDRWPRPRGDYVHVLGLRERAPSASLGVDAARMLGYLVGDGGLTTNAVVFTNADPAIVSEFRRIATAHGDTVRGAGRYGFRVALNAPPRTREEMREYRRRYAAAERTGSPKPRLRRIPWTKALAEEHGLMGHGAYSKTIPAAVFASSAAAQRAFIAGYFECDGTRGRRKGARLGAGPSFSTVNERLARDTQRLLAEHGIRARVATKRGLYKGQRHLSWLVTVVDEVRFFDILPIVGAKAGPSNATRHANEERVHLEDQVVSVVPAGTARCRCILVERDSSFVANGIVVHNSLLIFHWIARTLRYTAAPRILYLTYNDDFATAQMRECKPICQSAGVVWQPGTSLGFHDWRTPSGGTLYATGIGGAITGRPGGIIVVDDPIKDWESAQSRSIREAAFTGLRANILTRMHPGTSVIVVQTRWHEDDVAGRLIESGWESINLPAIDDEGRALWPEERPIEFLRAQQSERGVGPFVFEALYQGRPRPRGQEVFGPPTFCTLADIPTHGRIGRGVDLSYTAKTSSDWSVSIVMRECEGVVYVVDVVRKQVRAPDFLATIRAHDSFAPGTRARWYCSGTEQGVSDTFAAMNGHGAHLDAIVTRLDKFTRAVRASAAWNAGKVRVPSDASWSAAFVDELVSFTGISDPHDDQVDAFVAAFDSLTASTLGTGIGSAAATTSSLRRATRSLGRVY